MKIIYFTFIFFNKYDSMPLLNKNTVDNNQNTENILDNNQNSETTKKDTLSEDDRKKYAKIIYSFAITSSLLTLGFTIWNYLTANN